MSEELAFVGHILDNVHGFIQYTEAEKKIMDTQLFKRLQSIKQLSVVNWVFPGSEHTRYIHSLGVMHIADKMAKSLKLTPKERKLIRLAGLLHDIGHYPLSHVCESPYKNSFALCELPSDEEYCKECNKTVVDAIDGFTISTKTMFMFKSKGLHHEAIGATIVQNNEEIRKIIIDEIGDENAPNIIADIITGNVEREEVNPLLVQIIHSELDADGIDYLMRDATFSGTSFGSFEIDLLISCLKVGVYEGKRIMCVTPKGIAAADQYLINKFFSYSQVVFNRHIVISEWMAQQVVNWMQKHHAIFPNPKTLEKWARGETKEDQDKYLAFTDNMFWSVLERILSDELSDLVPHYIKTFCKHLLHHDELVFIPESEIRIVSSDEEEIKIELQKSDIKNDPEIRTKRLAILSDRQLTAQVSIESFEKEIKRQIEEGKLDMSAEEIKTSRLMECISVIEDDKTIRALCDDHRSLMRSLTGSKLVLLRSYEFPKE